MLNQNYINMSTQKFNLELPTEVLENLRKIGKQNHRERKPQCEFILTEFANNPFTIQCANETEYKQLTNHLAILRSEVKN